jgi:hypothetical protein
MEKDIHNSDYINGGMAGLPASKYQLARRYFN